MTVPGYNWRTGWDDGYAQALQDVIESLDRGYNPQTNKSDPFPHPSDWIRKDFKLDGHDGLLNWDPTAVTFEIKPLSEGYGFDYALTMQDSDFTYCKLTHIPRVEEIDSDVGYRGLLLKEFFDAKVHARRPVGPRLEAFRADR